MSALALWRNYAGSQRTWSSSDVGLMHSCPVADHCRAGSLRLRRGVTEHLTEHALKAEVEASKPFENVGQGKKHLGFKCYHLADTVPKPHLRKIRNKDNQ